MSRRWIPVIFWIALVAVLVLSSYFPRLRTVWPALLLVAVGGLVVNHLVQVLRGRPMPSCSNTRWWMRVLMDKERKLPKQS
jgi:uncharacterized membrane protein YoaK (UPF0700 family)